MRACYNWEAISCEFNEVEKLMDIMLHSCWSTHTTTQGDPVGLTFLKTIWLKLHFGVLSAQKTLGRL